MASSGRDAIVVGGSIGGLAAAVVLRRQGFAVRVVERAKGPPVDRGAGLGLDPGLTTAAIGPAAETIPHIRLTGRTLHQAPPFDGKPPAFVQSSRDPGGLVVSSWAHLHAALSSAFDGSVEYGRTVSGVELAQGRATVAFADGERAGAMLVIGADGHDSAVRRVVAPAARPTYSGYMLWRGFVDETAIEPGLAARFMDGTLHVFARRPFHLVAYAVPGPDGVARRLNWGWYAAVADTERAAMTARAGLAEGTMVLPATALDPGDRSNWVARAAEVWPADWAALVAATAAAGAMFGNAIHDLAPTALSAGPVALAGDAGHLLSPITGSGARLALEDAVVLEECLERYADALDEPGALAEVLAIYGRERVRVGEAGVTSARRWAREALEAEPA